MPARYHAVMVDDAPSGYETRATADGARYILPKRELDGARWFGLILMLFGGVFSGFATFWIWGASQSLWNSQGQFQWTGLPFTLFGVPFVIAGLFPFGIGLILIAGRSEIIIRGGKLIAREKVGPFFWSRKRLTDAIERFELVRDHKFKSKRGDQLKIDNLSAFRALGSSMKPMIVAWGYQREVLERLANDLAEQCQAHGPAKLFDDPGDAIAVVDAPPEESGEETERTAAGTLPDPPADTGIVLDVHDSGVTLTIPPAGLRSKGAKGMFSFSLLWCGFTAVFTTLMIFADDRPGGSDLWFAIAFIAVFWVIGIGMLFGTLIAVKRRAIIDVVGFPPDAVLLMTRRGLFGMKQQEVSLDQIEAIRIDNSGMEVNNTPVKNLQIHRKKGKKLGLLSGRDEEELRWIAAVLRYALDVPAKV